MLKKDPKENGNTKSIALVIEGFIFHCKYEKNLSQKTISAYLADLGQYRKFLEERNFPENVFLTSREILKDYLQALGEYKAKTIKRKIASLKAMFNHLEYEDEMFINPFRKLKLRIKEPKVLPVVMNIGEIKKILSAIYRDLDRLRPHQEGTHLAIIRNIAVMETLFATGIRVSELANLTPENIDVKNGTIKVLGKGRKERIIQICDNEAKLAVNSYYNKFKEKIDGIGYFFINRIGKKLTEESVRSIIRKYAKKANIAKNVTPHTFRHTFATLLLEENVDIRYIQHLLGHSNITTTQIYTHINNETQRRILTAKHPRRKLSFRNSEAP